MNTAAIKMIQNLAGMIADRFAAALAEIHFKMDLFVKSISVPWFIIMCTVSVFCCVLFFILIEQKKIRTTAALNAR